MPAAYNDQLWSGASAASEAFELDLAPDPADLYANEEQELFLGSVTRKVRRAASKAVRKAAGSAYRVAKTVQGVAKPAGIGSLARFGRDIASGKNVWRSAKRAGRGVVADVRQQLHYAQMAAPFVPGVGSGIAAALGAAEALASGRSITDAAIAAARGAIPGGALARSAFDVGLDLAKGRSLSATALAAARRRLPGGPAAQAAFDTAVALGRGKSLQEAARLEARQVPRHPGLPRPRRQYTRLARWRPPMPARVFDDRELATEAREMEFAFEALDDEWKAVSPLRLRAQLPPGQAIPNYTLCDFIHENIDVSAQYALYGMLKGDVASRNAAVQMLTAVKTGRLGGIYQEDQAVPGMRGIHLGYGGYGPLIDTYKRSAMSAACIPPAAHPKHKLEIISFRKSLAKDRTNLAELRSQLLYLQHVARAKNRRR